MNPNGQIPTRSWIIGVKKSWALLRRLSADGSFAGSVLREETVWILYWFFQQTPNLPLVTRLTLSGALEFGDRR